MRRFSIMLLLLCIPFSAHAQEATQASSIQLQQILQIGRGPLRFALWNPEGTLIAVGGDDGVRLLDNTFREIGYLDAGDNFAAAWSPDGSRLALGGTVTPTDGSEEVNASVWDVTHQTRLLNLEVSDDGSARALTLDFSPNGEMLLGARGDSVTLWDAASGALRWTITPAAGRYTRSIDWSPDGDAFVVAGQQYAQVWNIPDFEMMYTLLPVTELESITFAYSASWSPDGSRIALAAATDPFGYRPKENALRIFDAETGSLQHAIQAELGSVSWSPDGTKLATGSEEAFPGLIADERPFRMIYLWDADTGEQLIRLAGHTRASRVQWHPDGRRLLSAAEDNTIILWRIDWDLELGIIDAQLYDYMDSVLTVDWSPDGNQLATGSNDGNVRTWNAHTGVPQALFVGNERAVQAVAWAADSATLASGGADRSVRGLVGASLGLYGRHERTINPGVGNPDGVLSVGWNMGGVLASSGLDGAVRIWNGRGPGYSAQILMNSTFPISIGNMVWSLDGNRIFAAAWEGVDEWDVNTSERLRTFTCDSDDITTQIAMNTDQTRLAAAVDRHQVGYICIWDTLTGQLETSMQIGDTIHRLRWRPNGDYLATITVNYNFERSLRLWDIRSGKLVGEMQSTTRMNDLVWSPDGTQLAIGMSNGRIHILSILQAG